MIPKYLRHTTGCGRDMRVRPWWPAFCLCLSTFVGWAQATPGNAAPGAGGYSAMKIERVGKMVGGFNGTLKQMSGGVSIVLESDDPNLKPLPIRADSMTFQWTEGKNTPDVIVLEGNVAIEHPQATVTAERAEWNFDRSEVVFTGHPVMNSERVKDLRGDRMVLNFEKNTFEVVNASVKEVAIRAETEGTAPALAESQIKDFKGLLSAMQKEARGERPSPGKRLVSLLDADMQSALLNATPEMLEKQKGAILKVLNRLLQKPNLYDAQSWESVTLPAEAKELLALPQRTPAQTVQLNRLLLQAAYPQYLTGGA